MSETTNTTNMTRANKVTAYWEGEGIAVGVFYKTHSKITTVKSNEDQIIKIGFVMPTGTDEAPVTASAKLKAFKDFICANAAKLGILYDATDRRDDNFKFPSHYNETNVMEFSKKMLSIAMEKVLGSVQANVVDRMVKAKMLADGSKVQYGIGDGTMNITEKYNNGYIKYATVNYPVAIAVNGKQADSSVTVELVSGQIKKPCNIGDTVMTMSGVKEFLVSKEILPKAEAKKPEKKQENASKDATEAPKEASGEVPATPAEA